MIVSPLNSRLLGPLLADQETSDLFSEESAVRAILRFEVALARAEERAGVIPPGAASAIERAAAELEPDWRELGSGAAAAGHPVAALVGQLRRQAGSAGSHVHRGATAQDAIDTALVTALAEATQRFDAALRAMVESLAGLAREHRATVMAGRTRSQHAVPVSFGLKAAGWMLPLARHRRRLADLAPRALVLQFGGAAGTLGALGSRGLEVSRALSRELGLPMPPAPWHGQRDGMLEVAGWLSMVTASLAKLGQDLVLMAQTEVREAADGSAGISSAMPHKSNPVRSETLVSIGRMNAALLAGMHQAAIHEHERSGSAWTLEWLTLPQMAALTGAALRLGQAVTSDLAADPARMRLNVERSRGLLLAEAAATELGRFVPLEEARSVVAAASRAAVASDEGLIDILERTTHQDVDWGALRDPGEWLGSAAAFIDRALRAAGQSGHAS